MNARISTIILTTALSLAASAFAEGLSEEDMEIRARAVAERRAQRDAARAERLTSRPVVLRDPIPLPVRQTLPPGGEPAAKSCPATESCKVEYSVPSGKVLVVSALWSAADVRCDQTSLAATPANGQSIAPWWNCKSSFSFSGKAAGFTGYLFESPTGE